jgi:DDE family transposase
VETTQRKKGLNRILRRFGAYLVNVFEFRRQVDRLRDGRQRPQIPTANVWLSAFLMFVLRARSFNALEQELRRSKRGESFVGKQKPSADTIGRVFGGLHTDGLRQLVVMVNRASWRRKAIHLRADESYRVIAVDGHELWASRSRCCDRCQVRERKVGKKEEKKTVKEYYHRVVVAQWVGVTPPPILDLELINPEEGEVVAARRLIKRVLSNYSRLIDVITADALYLEAPFIREVLEAGKHIVVVMKQNQRDLFEDADRLRGVIQPRLVKDGDRTTNMWDIPDLTSFTTLGLPVRVVWAEEETVNSKIIGGKRQEVLEKKTWVWVTDLPSSIVPAAKIQLWGHDRWNLENRGFNELTTLWHMDHCFIHQPNAIEALLLTLALAFLTTYLFFERNLKPAARPHLTRLALATRFMEDLCLLNGASVWASLQRPG